MSDAKPNLIERMMPMENRELFLRERAVRYEREVEEYLGLCSYLISDRCTEDIQRLIDGDYTWPLARMSLLRKFGTTKRRAVFVYPDGQRHLLMYLSWHLHCFDDIFCDSLYSFRTTRKPSTLFKQVKKRKLHTDHWAVKTDVSSYFNSIDPERLVAMLRERIGGKEPELVDFMAELLLRGEYTYHGEIQQGSMGAIAGAAFSNFFGNVYLMELDEEMERQGELYARYSDDICVFVKTREEAEAVLAEITRMLTERGLKLNQGKTEIHPPCESFGLLGFQLRGEELDVADFTLYKARRKMRIRAKKLNRRVSEGKITREDATRYMIRYANRFFFGGGSSEMLKWTEWFFGVITRPDSLVQLDEYVQNLIRYVATGKLGKARYRMSHERLKELGYCSLVSAYWKNRHEDVEQWRSVRLSKLKTWQKSA